MTAAGDAGYAQTDFTDRVVFVTGAAAGIGRGVAGAFARQGARVFAADIDRESLTSLVGETADARHVIAPIALDVTDSTAVDEVFSEIERRAGGVDMLVCAAGGFGSVTDYAGITDEIWNRAIAVNLSSVFYCCRAVLPKMSDSGRVIIVSSAAGRMPTSVTAAYYAASKAGVLGLARHLAREVADRGITVNCVAPGTTLSPRVTAMYGSERIAAVSAQTPLGRLAEVDEQVGPILFLASAAADYITGATLDVNGGKVML